MPSKINLGFIMSVYPLREGHCPLRTTHDYSPVNFDVLQQWLQATLSKHNTSFYEPKAGVWHIMWERDDFHIVNLTVTVLRNHPGLWGEGKDVPLE